MSNVMKLTLAVILALAAAGLNAMWLSAEKHPTTYAAAAADLPAGQVITAEAMMPVPIPGNDGHLKESLIPFANNATLLGLKTSRNYIKGDMFFQSDIKAPLEVPEYEALGPFKLISVGSRFTKTNGKADDVQVESSGNNITIAVSSKLDDLTTRRLQQIVDPNRTNNKDKPVRIVAIQVLPKEEQKTSAPPPDKDVVFQTISLDGITNVPRVLLAGDVIRFVIPAHSSY